MTETTTVIYSSRPLGALLLANAISWTGNSFAIVALPWFAEFRRRVPPQLAEQYVREVRRIIDRGNWYWSLPREARR